MQENKLHKTIIYIVVGVFFSYVLSYLFQQSLEFIILTIGVTFTLVLRNQHVFKYFIKLPIYRWILFYFIVSLIWMLLPNLHSTYGELRTTILYTLFLFTITTLLYFDNVKLANARQVILLVTLVAIFNNIFEFFNPSAFYSEDSEIKILGRSAGFYINANIAGEAIILGMILSYGLVPNKFKVTFLFIALLGIVATFSRTSMAAWFMVIMIMGTTQAISKKDILVIIASLFIAGSIVVPILINFIDLNLEGAAENLLTRLDFFSSNTTSGIDESQQTRIDIAKSAFSYFTNNPLLGGGLGLTYHWEHAVSTHNMYLLHMAEFGIIGFFIYPLLIISTVWRARGEARQVAFAFTAYAFVIGFTTHDILKAPHILTAFAVMAGWSYRSRTIYASNT